MYFRAECDNLVKEIKEQSFFPFKTGHLKFDATKGELISENIYLISFDSTIAEYLPYLEEGTTPHDIPQAFGKPLPFGIGGRFNGKFHPGSNKHKGFIKDKTINYILNYFTQKYEGELK